ncbi:hypothetical protein GR927_28855 [Mycolicibacterium sp. 3033]|nr:hypothetical protein [Mycolicibacterium aurantiacum]
MEKIAWQFLSSEFASCTYADLSLDRRLDIFLRRNGYRALRDDGTAYQDLLDRVMVNISVAIRNGTLPGKTHRS